MYVRISSLGGTSNQMRSMQFHCTNRITWKKHKSLKYWLSDTLNEIRINLLFQVRTFAFFSLFFCFSNFILSKKQAFPLCFSLLSLPFAMSDTSSPIASPETSTRESSHSEDENDFTTVRAMNKGGRKEEKEWRFVPNVFLPSGFSFLTNILSYSLQVQKSSLDDFSSFCCGCFNFFFFLFFSFLYYLFLS